MSVIPFIVSCDSVSDMSMASVAHLATNLSSLIHENIYELQQAPHQITSACVRVVPKRSIRIETNRLPSDGLIIYTYWYYITRPPSTDLFSYSLQFLFLCLF